MYRKNIKTEYEEQIKQRKIFDAVSNSANRSEKTSWNRKMDNMVKLLAKLRPIEEQILELQAQKMPVYDEVQVLRLEMINQCVHPYEYLVLHDEYVICKFCDKKMNKPSTDK